MQLYGTLGECFRKRDMHTEAGVVRGRRLRRAVCGWGGCPGGRGKEAMAIAESLAVLDLPRGVVLGGAWRVGSEEGDVPRGEFGKDDERGWKDGRIEGGSIWDGGAGEHENEVHEKQCHFGE